MVSLPPVVWKSLVRRDHVWKEIWLVTFLFAGMRRLRVYTKVKPGRQLLLQLSRSYSDCISQII